VRFSPPSINKNDKSDGEKNHEYLANGSSDFNRTEKFGINTKNYTRKEPNINNLDQGWNTGIRQENRSTIPGNSNRKTQREAESQVKQCQDEFLGRNSTNSLLYCIYFY
jgi:hypothetical protein